MKKDVYIYSMLNRSKNNDHLNLILAAYKGKSLPPRISKRIMGFPEFYQNVWKACYAIPKGKTLTYGEIAYVIGHPGAARAVGTALSKNPLAPIIPCHRVIRTDGGYGGYSAKGGLKTKIKLLKKEKIKRVSLKQEKTRKMSTIIDNQENVR